MLKQHLGLFCFKLQPQGLGHGGRRGTGQTQGDLNSIVDEPLESSQSTDHDDTGEQSLPQTSETKLLSNTNGSGALTLVQLGDNGISRVRHDGTEDTSNLTSCECHYQLLRLAALFTWLGDHILVQCLHSTLKAGKLHHGVGDLATP